MDADDLQTIAARDQFWATLRALLPEIEQLAAGQLAGTPREWEIAQLLARVVVAELHYRAQRAESE
jgi:hypothetical protein